MRTAPLAGIMPMLLLLASLRALPAQADDGLDKAQVSACLAEHRDTPSHCAAIILAPCAEATSTGESKDCHLALRLRWLAEIRHVEATDPDIASLRHAFPDWYGQFLQMWFDAREQDCQDRVQAMSPDRTINLPELQTACALWQAANWWHLITTDRKELLAQRAAASAEIESLEACLLEAGAAGHADQCIDLFTPDCPGSEPRRRCHVTGALVWIEMAVSAMGVDRYSDLLLDVDARMASMDEQEAARCLESGMCYLRTLQEATVAAFLEGKLEL